MHSWRAVTVLSLRPRMTAKQYRDAIQALGLSRAEAAQFFQGRSSDLAAQVARRIRNSRGGCHAAAPRWLPWERMPCEPVRAGRSVRILGAPAYFLCGALNKTSSTNAEEERQEDSPSPFPSLDRNHVLKSNLNRFSGFKLREPVAAVIVREC
jgi:hypothetical protein